MKKLDYIAGTLLAICILLFTFNMGYNVSLSENEPTSDLFWINNTRVHKDSVIDCRPIYNEYIEVIGSWIRVTHGNSTVMIECLDLDGSTWKEFRSSWLMAFRIKSGEMTDKEALEEAMEELKK